MNKNLGSTKSETPNFGQNKWIDKVRQNVSENHFWYKMRNGSVLVSTMQNKKYFSVNFKYKISVFLKYIKNVK